MSMFEPIRARLSATSEASVLAPLRPLCVNDVTDLVQNCCLMDTIHALRYDSSM